MNCFSKVVLLMMMTSVLSGCQDGGPNRPAAPVAKMEPTELTAFGETRVDNYFWMRHRENPEVIQHLEAENAYLKEMLAHTDELQHKLFEEMKGRIKKDDTTVPYLYNGYLYYSRYEKGGEYALHCRRPALGEVEEVYLNGNTLATGAGYFSLAGVEVSPDGRKAVYGIDTAGRRFYTLRVKDLDTGNLLEDVIPDVTGDVTWAMDNRTLFYTRQDPETLRSYQVWRHELGAAPGTDTLIFEEEDDTFDVSVERTKSERFLVISSSQTLSTEHRILEADNPFGEFRIFEPRHRDLEYGIDHQGDRFIILTNHEALNFRLMECDLNNTGLSHWRELIPHRKDVFLEDLEVFDNWLVLAERFDGLTHLKVIPADGSKAHYLDFGEPTWSTWLATNVSMESGVLRFGYSSLTTPSTTFDYDMATREKTLLKQTEVLGGFLPENYQAEYVQVPAADGTLVPVSLVYRKGFKPDSQSPLLLYAYGSYGYSMDASFGSSRLSLLDRGFVYAIAHVRGGEEKGRAWYEDGKLLNKKNTFTDFIDCGNYLVDKGYTAHDRLFAMGGSAGGLLMGAIMNMAPEVWRGVVAQVPWVDVVTTMQDDSIPLTTSEYDEWGNPADEEYYRYMLSYSPYDNVRAMNYPATLVTTGLHDSQVQYWEPAKWVARLREMKTDDNPLLFKINMEAGHGGASGRFRRLEETALSYAFMLDLLGIRE